MCWLSCSAGQPGRLAPMDLVCCSRCCPARVPEGAAPGPPDIPTIRGWLARASTFKHRVPCVASGLHTGTLMWLTEYFVQIRPASKPIFSKGYFPTTTSSWARPCLSGTTRQCNECRQDCFRPTCWYVLRGVIVGPVPSLPVPGPRGPPAGRRESINPAWTARRRSPKPR